LDLFNKLGKIAYQVMSQMTTKSWIKWITSQRPSVRLKKANKAQTLVQEEGPFHTNIALLLFEGRKFIRSIAILEELTRVQELFSGSRQQALSTRAVYSQRSNSYLDWD